MERIIRERPGKKDLTTRFDWVFDNYFTEDLTKEEKNGPKNNQTDWITWSGQSWSELFKKYYENYNELKRCGLRCLVLQSTVHVCRSLRYRIQKTRGGGNEIKLDPKFAHAPIYGTRFYADDFEYRCDKDPSEIEKFNSLAEVKVVNGDCVEASFILKERCGKKVAVLNMANRWEPSAGWPMKYGTQEEQLFRRSNLYQCLDNDVDNIEKERKWKYPIDEFGQIFSPEVVFFRSGEGEGYNFIRPRALGVITAAALTSPEATHDPKNDEYRLTKDAEEKMRKKIRLLFKVCLEHGYQNVVFSAWGSGAFRTPPKHIAELFQMECIQFGRYFENIWFSILEDGFSFRKWNKGGNLAPYAIVFNQKEPEKIQYKYNEF